MCPAWPATLGARRFAPSEARPGAGLGPPDRQPARRAFASLLIVQPGEPGGQALHRILERGIEIDELAQAFGQPPGADLLVAAPLGEFLDATIGEVHGSDRGARPGGESTLDERLLLRRVHGRRAD